MAMPHSSLNLFYDLVGFSDSEEDNFDGFDLYDSADSDNVNGDSDRPTSQNLHASETDQTLYSNAGLAVFRDLVGDSDDSDFDGYCDSSEDREESDESETSTATLDHVNSQIWTVYIIIIFAVSLSQINNIYN